MFEKMSDGDVMVCFKNMMLMMSKLVAEKGISVSAYCEKDGFSSVRLGDYEILQSYADGEIKYSYQPIDNISAWSYDLSPQQVRFGQAPMESSRTDSVMLHIHSNEYEELVRDSEKVRILTQAMEDDLLPGEAWIRCILGMQQEEEDTENE